MFLPWPREMHTDDDGNLVYGDLMPFPGILYREILPQDQVFGTEGANYTHSVNNIIRDSCLPDGGLSPEQETLERSLFGPYCYDGACCGDRPPECCRNRQHISAVMKEHYPRVTYFRRMAERCEDDNDEEILEEIFLL